ncbi:RNA polymerase sigma factor [Paractinoplanes rishiriensis]|uniref:RNA polymerase sigma24 factor n=1 Tax=Paractinoplanes rishiriensis TaxID=1050105 RepID=A0A919MRG4_9ACTN|nr:sigma-70 family RNA polymerase sigma factor [Actinoplanes rishiriensis]GIE97176.1 RNA polymerase sigma24 factor [Actinoplanes rishiriensis]
MTADLLRRLAPEVLGVLARRSGDFGAAEDAVQEALIAAHLHWPAEGVPDNPRAWLIQTATRKLIDAIRGEQARRRREELAARLTVPVDATDRDDTLAVLFMSCHPSLTPASAIALALRAVGGLTTAEIAAAFVVPEATMAQRISRAKQRLRSSGARFALPAEEWTGALRQVRHVLYLIFNEGYAVSTGPALQRTDLTAEAIRLTRLAHEMLPSDAETAGLLALMLLTDARRPARTDASGDLIPLDEQDRSRWDRRSIIEGIRLIDAAIVRGELGEYQLQAAIAALHDRAPRAADTDWPQILALYGLLERMTGNPVVSLNRAVAEAMVHGPAAGLKALDDLGDRLPAGHRVDAVRAHLLERAGQREEAARLYAAAAAATTSLPERRYLTTRAARLR